MWTAPGPSRERGKGLYRGPGLFEVMAKEKAGAGFQQAAGLIRYFEAEEESAIHLDPRAVIGACLLIAMVTIVLNWQCTPGTGCF